MNAFCEISYNEFFKCHNFKSACIPFVENSLSMDEFKAYNPKKVEVVNNNFFDTLYDQHLRDEVSLIVTPEQIKKFMAVTLLCDKYRKNNLNPNIQDGVHIVDLDFKQNGFIVPFVRTFIVNLKEDNLHDSWTKMCALLDMTFDYGERHGTKSSVMIYDDGYMDTELLTQYKKVMPLLTDDFNRVVFCNGQNSKTTDLYMSVF